MTGQEITDLIFGLIISGSLLTIAVFGILTIRKLGQIAKLRRETAEIKARTAMREASK